MSTATMANPSEFLLEQAQKVCGARAYEDYIAYSSASEEQRETIDGNIKLHHERVQKVIDTMASYGSNHWWITFSRQELEERYPNLTTGNPSKQNKQIEAIIDLRRKVRIHYQLICGLDVLLVPQEHLLNDINDLLTPKGVVVTSWFLRNPLVFKRYETMLKEILDSDEVFQAFLKNGNSG